MIRSNEQSVKRDRQVAKLLAELMPEFNKADIRRNRLSNKGFEVIREICELYPEQTKRYLQNLVSESFEDESENVSGETSSIHQQQTSETPRGSTRQRNQ